MKHLLELSDFLRNSTLVTHDLYIYIGDNFFSGLLQVYELKYLSCQACTLLNNLHLKYVLHMGTGRIREECTNSSRCTHMFMYIWTYVKHNSNAGTYS